MSQQLFIPSIGSVIVLAKDWTFKVRFENRNASMLEALGMKKGLRYYSFYWKDKEYSDEFKEGEKPFIQYEKAMTPEELEQSYKSYAATNSKDTPYIECTLPKGTQLKFDRIYIRQGSQAFNSITFRTTKNCPDKRFASRRFWVKLQEANEIVADIIG